MMRTKWLRKPDGSRALARRARTVGAGTLGGLMTEASVAQQSPVLPFHGPSRRCKLTVIGIFLATFAIPVTFESIMWVMGSGSLANVASDKLGRELW